MGALVALTFSCSFDSSLPSVPADATRPGADAAGPGIDASNPDIDASNPGIDAPGCQGWTYMPEHFDPCTVVQPTGALILVAGNFTYNTDDGSLTGPGGPANPPHELLSLNPEVRLIALNELQIRADATLRVEGMRPLLIASWGDIIISGTLDVSSTLGDPGAGSNPTECNARAPSAGQQDDDGGGGGGGGGFASDGGDGGDGGGFGAKGVKGVKVSSTPNNILGGCDGAPGGDGDRLGGGAGFAGPGGGAIYLAAQNSITVSGLSGAGLIKAGGAGGGGADGDRLGNDQSRRSGGGGGGSGGYIGLEAPTLTVENGSILVANGGGGGGGCNNNKAGDGQDGQDDATAASGGPRETADAGDGGDGGFSLQGDADSGLSATFNRGGGGGGGGVGFIIMHTPSFDDQGATFSPLPQVNP